MKIGKLQESPPPGLSEAQRGKKVFSIFGSEEILIKF